MVLLKSQNQHSLSPEKDEMMLKILVAQLRDVQTLHSGVFSPEALRLTAAKAVKRFSLEGNSFITKQLPRLAKALDKALTEQDPVDAVSLGFKPQANSKLPVFLGELFNLVCSSDGRVLPRPCIDSIRHIRQVLYSFYKYELPYDSKTEEAVVSMFEETETEVESMSSALTKVAQYLDANRPYGYRNILPSTYGPLIRGARILLSQLFRSFDPYDIVPSHGPGAVSTSEKLWGKWTFTSVSPRLAAEYPLDAYFFASLSHVCDAFNTTKSISSIELREIPSKVVLVPKDSRGPRIISEECLSNQFVQQGLFRAIVRLVERHPLTMDHVHFTSQRSNQLGALLGSITGGYATLDLKEASDRVSVGLVKLLFPEHVLKVLLASRSLSTVLPGGRILKLTKFAPMGSSLCFPILALTVWAILTAGAPDTDARDSILVFGDDVVVTKGHVPHAIKHLEAFGLKVNRDKSCINGSFRESCGTEAYKGIEVTPVRFRTVWSSSRSPEALASFCSYANELYKRCFFYSYELIAGELFRIYGYIPVKEWGVPAPSLVEVPEAYRPRSRINSRLQKREYYVRYLKSHVLEKSIDGWSMLFRHLVETRGLSSLDQQWSKWELKASASHMNDGSRCAVDALNTRMGVFRPFHVRSYTRPRAVKLARGWRS